MRVSVAPLLQAVLERVCCREVGGGNSGVFSKSSGCLLAKYIHLGERREWRVHEKETDQLMEPQTCVFVPQTCTEAEVKRPYGN